MVSQQQLVGSTPVEAIDQDTQFECPRHDATRILDLVHLSCQTFGDPDLERDVLSLFLEQTRSSAQALTSASIASERGRVFHLIKGSANGVGAFQLASVAALGENNPADDKLIDETLQAIDRVSRQVGSLLKP